MTARTLPARFPPSGAWPGQMRADMVAAYLDYKDTAELAAAVKRGDAPAPSLMRGTGRSKEPVWITADIDRNLAPLVPDGQDTTSRKRDLKDLVG